MLIDMRAYAQIITYINLNVLYKCKYSTQFIWILALQSITHKLWLKQKKKKKRENTLLQWQHDSFVRF